MTWKTRRRLSYLMHEFDDFDLPYEVIEESDKKLVSRILRFFYEGSKLVYPAKSYFVAIVYAKMLERYFDISFYEALDQDDLLIDDSFYCPYRFRKEIYDKVLQELPKDFLTLKSTKKTIAYFKEEFLIGTDCESNESM